ncbi:MAG: Mu transposase C-terminal domain-containing protein, partial [Pseudodonghicola sp.]
EIRAFGAARRLPTWEAFVEQIEKTVADYNDRPHRGLPEFEDPDTGRIRHMTPNEAWAAHVADGFKAVTVEPAEADDLFRPYEIRTVQRAQVTINKNTYFDAALERYHKESVMVGYDYHQADKVWVREFDVKTGQPGKLICVAGFMANAQRYVPVTFEQQALETRAKTRLKRIETKAQAIEAELNAPYLLDQDATEISGELFDLRPQEAAPAAPQLASEPEPDPVKKIEDARPKRRVFASDEELAAWALDHPDELLPNQIAVLRRCMSNSTARELFRMSGIDTEALRNLLRAVA